LGTEVTFCTDAINQVRVDTGAKKRKKMSYPSGTTIVPDKHFQKNPQQIVFIS